MNAFAPYVAHRVPVAPPPERPSCQCGPDGVTCPACCAYAGKTFVPAAPLQRVHQNKPYAVCDERELHARIALLEATLDTAVQAFAVAREVARRSQEPAIHRRRKDAKNKVDNTRRSLQRAYAQRDAQERR